MELPTGRPRLRLKLKRSAAKAARAGPPWIFDGGIGGQNREGAPGEVAALFDERDKFLGLALYDPGSAIRARVIHIGTPELVDMEWWRKRFTTAIGRREGLFDESTTGYRLIHGENDGWPGLVLDRYGEALVLKIYSELWLPNLTWVRKLVSERYPGKPVVVRWSRSIAAVCRNELGVREDWALWGELGEGKAPFLETGIKFEVDVLRGQKTGFFLDQRENRRRVEFLAGGRNVLNLFSFAGGFSVYAARGGAVEVTDVDISRHAIDAARRTMELNSGVLGKCKWNGVQADAFDWLKNAKRGQYGLVICDPPSFAKKEREREKALTGYAALAAAAAKVAGPKGILICCSCSARVAAEEFYTATLRGIRRAGKKCVEIERSGHPADHPIGYPGGGYLKAILVRMDSMCR